MGGFRKTTTPRAICYEAKVKEAFPDGICFLEFGQDVNNSGVRNQFERFMSNFGGMIALAETKM